MVIRPRSSSCLRWFWGVPFVVVVVVGGCEGGVGGVWMDDGNGRTVLADSTEAADLASDILDVLDLPNPILHHRLRHHHHRHHANGSAPTWLKTIYNTLDEHGHANSDQMDETHRKTVTAADTIITFVSRGQSVHQTKEAMPLNVLDMYITDLLLF